MICQSGFGPLTFGLLVSLLFGTCIANTTEPSIVLECDWTAYSDQRGYRPDCPIASYSSTSDGQKGYIWSALDVAKALCESSHDNDCNTVEHSSPDLFASNDGNSHHYLNSCPTTHPDELEWIEDTRSGYGMNSAITYFYECTTNQPTSEPTGHPSVSPTTEPTLEPTTICEPHQNCTQCVSTNIGGINWCFWHNENGECYHIIDLQNESEDIYENVIVNEAECSTTKPTTVPSSEPTELPTAMPSNRPTHPTSHPTEGPSYQPTGHRPISPIAEPTVEPTAQCQPHRNCTECVSMNSNVITWCLWHFGQDRCHYVFDYNETVLNDNVAANEAQCTSTTAAISVWQTTETFQWILLLVIMVMICIMAILVSFLLCRRKKLRSTKERDIRRIEMVDGLSRSSVQCQEDMRRPSENEISVSRESRCEGIEGVEGNQTAAKTNTMK